MLGSRINSPALCGTKVDRRMPGCCSISAPCHHQRQAMPLAHAPLKSTARLQVVRLRKCVVLAGKGFGAPVKDPRADLAEKPCPCGSQKTYATCCKTYHTEDMAPMEVEAALRARFSAYVLKDAKYIMRSTHPRNPATKGSDTVLGSLVRTVRITFSQDVRASVNAGEYSDLSIKEVEPGANEDEAVVVCEYKLKQLRNNAGEKLAEPRLHELKERARFQRKQGEWLLIGSESNWNKNEMRTT